MALICIGCRNCRSSQNTLKICPVGDKDDIITMSFFSQCDTADDFVWFYFILSSGLSGLLSGHLVFFLASESRRMRMGIFFLTH